MFVAKRDQPRELKDGIKVYEHYTIEERFKDNGKIKTNNLVSIGTQPEPEEVVKIIENEELEDNKTELLRSFFDKADYVNQDYEDFENFLTDLREYNALNKFRKEKALHNLVATSLEDLFDNLSPFEVNNKFSEVEIPPAEGRIDVLAKDDNTGEIVVIELKVGTVEDEPIGQINRYINGVKEYLDPENGVRGLVIGEEFSNKFELAKDGLDNQIDTYTYELEFRLNQ